MAHYLRLGLTEAGRIIPVSVATVGLEGAGLPVAVAHPAVVAFLQGVTLIGAVWLSVILTQRIARQSLGSLLPQHLALVGLGALCWRVIVGL